MEICSSIKIPFKAQGFWKLFGLPTQINILFPLYTLICFFAISKCREGISTRKYVYPPHLFPLKHKIFHLTIRIYPIKALCCPGKINHEACASSSPLCIIVCSGCSCCFFTCRVRFFYFKSCHFTLIPVVFAAAVCFVFVYSLKAKFSMIINMNPHISTTCDYSKLHSPALFSMWTEKEI